MNNIEILEEWIKIDRKMRNNSTESDYDKFCEEKCIALENLIQENRELKERIKEYEKQLDLDYVEENYIPKSALQELLEHYKDTGYNELEEVLQELLEGE